MPELVTPGQAQHCLQQTGADETCRRPRRTYQRDAACLTAYQATGERRSPARPPATPPLRRPATSPGRLLDRPAVEHYPFGLPTTIVSLEAILLSTFVVVSQNRADERRQVLAGHQWQTVQQEEQQNQQLLRLSDQIRELTKAIHQMAAAQSASAGRPAGTDLPLGSRWVAELRWSWASLPETCQDSATQHRTAPDPIAPDPMMPTATARFTSAMVRRRGVARGAVNQPRIDGMDALTWDGAKALLELTLEAGASSTPAP